jgi:hypothetical protein
MHLTNDFYESQNLWLELIKVTSGLVWRQAHHSRLFQSFTWSSSVLCYNAPHSRFARLEISRKFDTGTRKRCFIIYEHYRRRLFPVSLWQKFLSAWFLSSLVLLQPFLVLLTALLHRSRHTSCCQMYVMLPWKKLCFMPIKGGWRKHILGLSLVLPRALFTTERIECLGLTVGFSKIRFKYRSV